MYLDRTQGVSSTELRSDRASLRLGFIGCAKEMVKQSAEVGYVNGMTVSGFFDPYGGTSPELEVYCRMDGYDQLLESSDAVFVLSHSRDHFGHVKAALEAGKHVICESPVALSEAECDELFALADERGLVFAEALKTAYATAYHRMLLLVQSGRIGRVVSVQSTWTSLADLQNG